MSRVLLPGDGAALLLSVLPVCGVEFLAGGTGMPIDGSGLGVLFDPLSLESGLVEGLGLGCVSALFRRLRLRRGVEVVSSLDSARLRRRGVGVGSSLDSTRLRRRRGVEVASSLDSTRLRSLTWGLASGSTRLRLRFRVGRSELVGAVLGTTIGIGAGDPLGVLLTPLLLGLGIPNGGVDPVEGVGSVVGEGEGIDPAAGEGEGVDPVVGMGEGVTDNCVTLSL